MTPSSFMLPVGSDCTLRREEGTANAFRRCYTVALSSALSAGVSIKLTSSSNSFGFPNFAAVIPREGLIYIDTLPE
jgi:hypothetical protein